MIQSVNNWRMVRGIQVFMVLSYNFLQDLKIVEIKRKGRKKEKVPVVSKVLTGERGGEVDTGGFSLLHCSFLLIALLFC